jgi:hypothetical protein
MVDGKRFIVTSLKNAAEFITKKDYFDNWKSELQEEFAFWSFSEWKKALQDAGFQVKENPNLPEQGSRAYINPWMVEHRFAGKVELYDLTSQGMRKRDYPVTNMVLVADKVTDKVAEE